jgi:hypothetical protein
MTHLLAHAGHAGHGPAWPGVVALLLLACLVLAVDLRRSGRRR